MWDAESLTETFREKAIRLRTMEPNLRRVALVGMAGIVVAGLLVAGHEVPFERVVVGGYYFRRIPVSAPALTACVALQVLAWGLLLTGAMHAHWPLRALVLALWSAAMLSLSWGALVAAPLSTRLGAAEVLVWSTVAGILLVVLLVWQLAIGVSVADRFDRRRAGRTHRHRLELGTGAACVAATALVYGLSWLSDPAPAGLANVSTEQEDYLALVMTAVLILTASDFTEWAEVAAGRMGTVLARRHRGLLAGGAAVICLGIVAYNARTGGGWEVAALSVLAVATLAAVALALGRLLVPHPPTELPPGVLIVTTLIGVAPYIAPTLVVASIVPEILSGVAPFFDLTLVGIPIGDGLAGAARALSGIDPLALPLPAFLATQAAVLPVAAALILAARRRRRLALAAFFLGILCVGLLSGFGVNALLGHGDGFAHLPGLALGPALACLALLAWSTVARAWSPRRLAMVRLLMVLALGLQLLDLLQRGFAAASEYGETLSVLQGVLLVAAMFWDLAMSGSAITNRHGPRAPRHSRVVLYLGYTLLASSAVTFWTLTQHSPLGGSTERWVLIGLYMLGPPLLVTYFTFGVLRVWRGAGEAEAAPAPETVR